MLLTPGRFGASSQSLSEAATLSTTPVLRDGLSAVFDVSLASTHAVPFRFVFADHSGGTSGDVGLRQNHGKVFFWFLGLGRPPVTPVSITLPSVAVTV